MELFLIIFSVFCGLLGVFLCFFLIYQKKRENNKLKLKHINNDIRFKQAQKTKTHDFYI